MSNGKRFWEPLNEPPLYKEMLDWLDAEIENAIDVAFRDARVFISADNDGEVVFDFETDFDKSDDSGPFTKRFKFADMVISFETPEDLASCFENMAKSIRDKTKQ